MSYDTIRRVRTLLRAVETITRATIPTQRRMSKAEREVTLSMARNFLSTSEKRMAEGQIFSITYVKALIARFRHYSALQNKIERF